jgi:hypothetical protein
MNRFAKVSVASLAALMLLGGCGFFNEDVTMSFELTDAPMAATVTAVNLTVSSVSVNESENTSIADSDGSWRSVAIDPPLVLNLLDLQNGVTAVLGDVQIKGGSQINQIRLGVDAVTVTDDGTVIEATMPSGAETGFKIVNAFDVPLSGAITVIIDFDVRKSIIKTGGISPQYIVKPTIRAIVDNEAGKIMGTAAPGCIVYAYAEGTWLETEATEPNLDGLYYTAAYSSAIVADTGSFTLAFLDPGVYDLKVGCPETFAVLAELDGVSVTAGVTTSGQELVERVEQAE